MRTAGWTGNPRWDDDALAAVHRYSKGLPRRINTVCNRVLQFAALEQQETITGALVEEVAEEIDEGLTGFEAQMSGPETSSPNGAAVNGGSNGHYGHSGPQSPYAGVPHDLLHRIEMLEEISARQDRIFQRIVKMLAAAVEKGS
jgi:hypothetical protein